MGVPLKANQIRAHTNTRGNTNYYMVFVNNSNDIVTSSEVEEFNIVWFRHSDEEAMYLVKNIKAKAKWVLEDDPVVVDNMNVMANALRQQVENPISDEIQVILDIYKNSPKGQRVVPAIQKWREITKTSLKEAKLAIEKLEKDYGLRR